MIVTGRLGVDEYEVRRAVPAPDGEPAVLGASARPTVPAVPAATAAPAAPAAPAERAAADLQEESPGWK